MSWRFPPIPRGVGAEFPKAWILVPNPGLPASLDNYVPSLWRCEEIHTIAGQDVETRFRDEPVMSAGLRSAIAQFVLDKHTLEHD